MMEATLASASLANRAALTKKAALAKKAAPLMTAVTLSALSALSCAFSPLANAAEFSEALPAEPIPSVAKIDTPYPRSYAMVHDFGFGSLIDSSFALVDTANRRFKGMLSGGNFATLNLSMRRQEFYVGETYYSRGTRGTRTDLVTIYDMENLDRLAEIELPNKRAAIVVNKAAVAITQSEKFLLVFNMSPGTSVSVVNLETRQFVGEIATPGCSLVYPTNKHDFFMLCGDGSLQHIALAADGTERSRERSEPFIDIDNDPLSEKSSKVGDTWHFVSFKGDVQPVGSTRRQPRIHPKWPLTTDEERAANWRPAGWHWTAAHPNDRLWVGMTPNGYDGSHKDPAAEVWLYDTKTQARLKQIKLNTPALSIDVTLEDEPRLLVVTATGALDVYDAMNGDYLRSIYDLGASPYQVHRMQ